MARQWMPLYVADYLADTMHLTAAESGAYLHLIMHYWANDGLPDDDRKLARIARMTDREWIKARATIREFFNEGWRHQRIDEEVSKSREISNKRKSAAKQMHSKCSANAEQKHTQSQSQSQEDTEAKASGAIAPIDPSISERELFERGKEVLGAKAGGQIANLKAHFGGNVALARAAIETASTKHKPAQYVAAIIRGPPAGRPTTFAQQKRVETQDILNDLERFSRGGSSGSQADSGVFPGYPGERSEGLRGGSGANVVELSAGGRRESG